MRFPVFTRCLVGTALAIAFASLSQAGPRIGVVLKARSGFWEAADRGARAAAAEYEAEVVTKSPQSETDIGSQIQMFNTLVDQGCEAIVLAPSSKDALVEPVKAAMGKGVKVVIIDTRLAGDVAPVFVGTDQVEAGREAGRLLGSLVADGDLVCVLRHNQTSGATEQREAGALEALRAAHPGLVVKADIYASTERGMETVRAGHLLDQNPGVKGILASGTPGTTAMLKVLRDRGAAGSVRFVGFGFSLNTTVVDALEDGAMDGWVAQIPADMGAGGVRAAVALLRGEPVEPEIFTRFVVVTKENVRTDAVLELLAR